MTDNAPLIAALLGDRNALGSRASRTGLAQTAGEEAIDALRSSGARMVLANNVTSGVSNENVRKTPQSAWQFAQDAGHLYRGNIVANLP